MAIDSKIEWTEATWNPTTGCTKVSAGCKNCYAERMAKRLHAMGQKNYSLGFEPSIQEHMLDIPLRWKKPRTIFVDSMSDLFHKSFPLSFIQKTFNVMASTQRHRFQLLTKRSSRLREINGSLDWKDNIWMGVSVENQECTWRIDDLRNTNAKVKFISLEPLLSPIKDLNLNGIDWVIVGGESGYGARVIKPEWVIQIRDECLKKGVPFFFKQWGGVNKKKAGRKLNGQTWSQMPIAAGV